MHKVSVIIPTLNRARMLAATLDRIEQQTVGHDQYEVIVVDNNSSDGTQSLLAAKAAAYPNLRYFSQTKRGSAATRNVGIRAASGEIVLFIDDDILAEPNLIEEHLRYHAASPNSAVIGAVDAAWEDATDPFLRYLRDKGVFSPYSLTGARQLDFSYYHTGNVSTPRRMLCDASGFGFNEEFSIYGMEDIELGYRLEKNGCRMTHGPDARARHEYFPTYEQFIERCQQAGFSLGKLIELHPELRKRFTESGKRLGILKRLHFFYPVLVQLSAPLLRVILRWEERRGSAAVTSALEHHYYWAIRYHFFRGYCRYTGSDMKERQAPTVVVKGREKIPKLAVERHE